MASDSKTPETPDDRYLDLDGLSRYSGMSPKSLRRYMADPDHPLPNHYVRPAGKGRGRIMVSRRAFDRWVAEFPAVEQKREDREMAEAIKAAVKSIRG